MTTTEEIDWKRKCEQLISQSIEESRGKNRRLIEKGNELETAKARIKELETQVRKLTPAAEKLKEEQAKRYAESFEHADQILEARRRVQRGQRGVIEDVIAMLQDRAARLPLPVTEEDPLP